MSNLQLAKSSPAEIITSLEDALALGEIVAKSGMFPDVKTQAQAVMIILAGREMSIPPMAALRGMFVSKGKTEFYAGLLSGMVKASSKYDYCVVKADDAECEITWFESGRIVGTTRFTIEEARRAKLIKPGGAWETFPSDLCFARALTRGVRRYAPDITRGAAYAPGEISELDLEPGTITIDAALDPVSERIGAYLRSVNYEDNSGTRSYVLAGIRSQAWQGLANTLRQPVESVIAEFKDLIQGEKIEQAMTEQEQAKAGKYSAPRAKHQPAPQTGTAPINHDPNHRGHDAEHASRFDAVIHRLVAHEVKGIDLLREVNAVVSGEMGRREIVTRYELLNDEVDAVCEVFEKWAEKLEKAKQPVV